jgi:hypothetical protein
MKPASKKPVRGHHRCHHLSDAGRQCRNWVVDTREMFCHRHLVAHPNGPDDFAFQLLNRSCNFQNAQGIHDSLQRVYTLLAADLISPRRAAVLGYLTSLLLRTLPAQYNDPYPQAGTPMSAAQMAERAKPKSLAPPALQAAAPTSTNKPEFTDKPVITDNPVPQIAAQPSPQSPAYPSPTTTVALTPPPPPTPATSKPPIAAPSQTTTEIPPQPANSPPFKKPYQVRLPTTVNWPITGSPPPWGWTTDP